MCDKERDNKMIVAILLFSIFNCMNTFLMVLILLSIYGKCEDVIGYIEVSKNAIRDIAKGFKESLKK